jgi:hypothetical protein
MVREVMSGSNGRSERYFRQAIQILRGELREPPDYYSIIAAAILGGDVLDHSRLEAAYPRSFAAVWRRIELMRLTCSVCGKPLERGARMPLLTDHWSVQPAANYRDHGEHLDTELRRIFVPAGDGSGVYPDAAPTNSTPGGRRRS